MREKGFAPPLVLVVVALGVLVIGVVAYSQLKLKPTSQPPTATQPIVATSPAKVDETANWKTFTSEQYGFSFRYPKELYRPHEICPGVEDPNYTVVLYTKKLSCKDLEAFPFSEASTSRIFAVAVLDKEFNLTEEYKKGATKDIEIKTELIDLKGIKAVKTTTMLNNEILVLVTFNWKGSGFQIIQGSADYDNKESLFNQIFSTFKFLD